MTYEDSRGLALRATRAQVDAINAALPDRTWVAPMDGAGSLYLGADLLSDCEDGGTYAAARALLEALPVLPWPDVPLIAE